MTPKHIVDIAFIITLLTQFAKLPELVLLESQRQRVQENIETLTLRLSYFNPSAYFQYIFGNRIRTLITMITGAAIVAIFYKSLYPAFTDGYRDEKGAVLIFVGLWAGNFSLYGKKAFNWLSDKTFGGFLGKLAWVFAANLAMAIPEIFIPRSMGPMANLLLLYDFILLISAVPIISLQLLLYGATVVLIKLLFYLVEILTKFLRFIFWRISIYNKGAVAAISLILTVVLGILSYFYHR